MLYLTKTPWLVEQLFSGYVWSMPGTEKTIYLSFDDGPHREATVFVLEELQQVGAKASFFCIGKNVVSYPEIYSRIVASGHGVGNHSYNHVNGWKTADDAYVEDIALAAGCIDSAMYRPPYGKITGGQARKIKARLDLDVVMWSVLSGDFDAKRSPEACLSAVLKATGAGSIVVFHDSEKAFRSMRYVLPRMLDHFGGQGYLFRKIVLQQGGLAGKMK